MIEFPFSFLSFAKENVLGLVLSGKDAKTVLARAAQW
jgi:hypothetical protein